MNLQIGKQIKNYRKLKGYTLNILSEKTGLSVSYLSMLERGLNSPTIENLNIICHALDITLPALIEKASATTSIVIHPDERRTIFNDSGLLYQALTEGDYQMSSIQLVVSDKQLHSSKGHTSDEVGYIISGSMTMSIGNTEYILNPGDCIYIESNQYHTYRCISDEPCVSFWTYGSSKHHSESDL